MVDSVKYGENVPNIGTNAAMINRGGIVDESILL